MRNSGQDSPLLAGPQVVPEVYGKVSSGESREKSTRSFAKAMQLEPYD